MNFWCAGPDETNYSNDARGKHKKTRRPLFYTRWGWIFHNSTAEIKGTNISSTYCFWWTWRFWGPCRSARKSETERGSLIKCGPRKCSDECSRRNIKLSFFKANRKSMQTRWVEWSFKHFQLIKAGKNRVRKCTSGINKRSFASVRDLNFGERLRTARHFQLVI